MKKNVSNELGNIILTVKFPHFHGVFDGTLFSNRGSYFVITEQDCGNKVRHILKCFPDVFNGSYAWAYIY